MQGSCVDSSPNLSDLIYIYNKTHNVLWGINMNSVRA
nr:MAG TPA: hypothetical protein [Bacteriophage sp.]